VGSILLAGALVIACVALPLWAVTAGDLNEVAGWANILALPLTALGLVLVLAGHDRARAVVDTVDSRRRPWMAPPLDWMVERPELGGQVWAALAAPTRAMVGLTTGLHGAGGFGKTRLATWLCHQPEIKRRFPGGLLWVTVGQEVHGADLAERINDLAVALGGQRPAISDPDVAGAELGRLLELREPVLLVIDDVWDAAQLRPFRFGAPLHQVGHHPHSGTAARQRTPHSGGRDVPRPGSRVGRRRGCGPAGRRGGPVGETRRAMAGAAEPG
jgi:hypothetical protein